MDHWAGASNPLSRTFMDSVPEMNFKDEALFQNYWLGQPATEPDYGFDFCRYLQVGSTNYEGFQPDMNYSPDNYTEIDDHGVLVTSARSGTFPFHGQISGKRRLDSFDAEDHGGGHDIVSPFAAPWGERETESETMNKDKCLRLPWDCLKKEEEFKMTNSSVFGFQKDNSAVGGAIPGNLTFGDHRSLVVRKMGEKRQTKPEKVIGLDVLRQHFAHSLKDAAKLMGVCPTTLKRICRQHGITRWPSRKIKKVNHSLKKLQLVVDSVEGAEGLIKIGSLYSNLQTASPPPPQQPYDDHFLHSDSSSSSQNSGLIVNPFENMKEVAGKGSRNRDRHERRLKLGKGGELMKVKATMGEAHIRFTLLPHWTFRDLQQEIAKRFSINGITGTCLKYIDNDQETVLLTCDDDLQECKELFCSNNCHMIKMTVHQAPPLP